MKRPIPPGDADINDDDLSSLFDQERQTPSIDLDQQIKASARSAINDEATTGGSTGSIQPVGHQRATGRSQASGQRDASETEHTTPVAGSTPGLAFGSGKGRYVGMAAAVIVAVAIVPLMLRDPVGGSFSSDTPKPRASALDDSATLPAAEPVAAPKAQFSSEVDADTVELEQSRHTAAAESRQQARRSAELKADGETFRQQSAPVEASADRRQQTVDLQRKLQLERAATERSAAVAAARKEARSVASRSAPVADAELLENAGSGAGASADDLTTQATGADPGADAVADAVAESTTQAEDDNAAGSIAFRQSPDTWRARILALWEDDAIDLAIDEFERFRDVHFARSLAPAFDDLREELAERNRP